MSKFYIHVGDKEYELHLGLNKLCDIEDHFGGKSISQIYLSGSPSITALREAVYVGLGGKKRRSWTRNEAGNLLLRDRSKLDVNVTEIIKAIAYAQGADEASLMAFDDEVSEPEEITEVEPLGELEESASPLERVPPVGLPRAVGMTVKG